MAVTQRDTQRHTYGDYLEWSRDYGDEIIDGVAYVREPPSPSPIHQELVLELSYQLRCALEGMSCRVCVAPFDVRFPRSDESDDKIETVVQPDVFIVCDRGRIDERGLRGAPDWLAEVLSPSTASYDQSVKLPLYERAGVPEVWLVHPTDRTLAIYRLEGGRYGRPIYQELKGQTLLSAVPTATIDWDRTMARLV
ncbi:MAG: Uma2 family endonuclease [Steroidobacteraceae bacterium]